MSWFYPVIILLIIFLLILSLTTVRLRLKYLRRGKDDEFALEVSVWRGILCYKLEIPVIEMKEKKIKPKVRPGFRRLLWPVLRPAFKIKAEVEGRGGRPIAEEKKKIRIPGPAGLIRMITDKIRLLIRYKPVIVYLLRRVHLRRFQWRTEIGTGDPSQTGFLTGTVWGVKGFLLSFIYRLLHPGGARPVVSVTPSFEEACFTTMLDCVFEVRIGYVIVTGFKALILRFT